MKSYLKRFALPAWLALLVLWPWVLHRMQRLPELPRSVLVQISERVDARLREVFGPSNADEYDDLYAGGMDGTREVAERGWRLSSAARFRALGAPILRRDLEIMAGTYAPFISNWIRVRAQGEDYRTIKERLAQVATPRNSEQMSLLHWTKSTVPPYLVARAANELLTGEATKAIDLLRDAAAFTLNGAYSATDAYWISASRRRQFYSSLVASIPDALSRDAEEQMLDLLYRMRSTDPRRYHLVALANELYWAQRFDINARLPRVHSYEEADLGRILELPLNPQDDATENKVSGAWIKHLDRKSGSLDDHPYGPRSPRAFSWSFRPAALKWSRLIAQSPRLRDPASWGFEINGIDTFSLLWLACRITYWNPERPLDQETYTAGRVAEAGIAARLYFSDHGDWPNSIEALMPQYLKPFDDRTSDALTMKFRDPVLHLARRPMDQAHREYLVQPLTRHAGFLNAHVNIPSSPNPNELMINYYNVGATYSDPVLWFALGEALKKNPLAEEVTLRRIDPIPRAGELDAETAQAAGDMYLANAALRRSGRHATIGISTIHHLTMTVRLRFPNELIVVWAEGSLCTDEATMLPKFDCNTPFVALPQGF